MVYLMKERLFVLDILITTMMVVAKGFSTMHDAEVDQLVKRLNKPALKSIKSSDGDIIECVHLKNHPIYDHPLFKNHTIQMKPSSYPKQWNNVSSYTGEEQSGIVTQLWTINGRCPKNSIPIRRTRKKDILRAKSIKRYGQKYINNTYQLKKDNFELKHEYAMLSVDGKFHGGRAHINVWTPHVQKKIEFSVAQIWVASGPNSELNTIEAGWQVSPNLYGDFHSHFFIYWTADGYQKTGCHNLLCPGFVLVNQQFVIGARIKDVSTMNGRQYDIPTTIWKDPRSGNWWLKLGGHTLVGYWLSTLFNYLKNGATDIHWGDEIADFHDDHPQHTNTNMGSGHFAQEGYRKASYFKNIEIVDEREILQQPVGIYPYMTRKDCYNLHVGNYRDWGTYFFYGGPGRNSNCL